MRTAYICIVLACLQQNVKSRPTTHNEIEKEKKIEDQIHSRIQAFKDTVRRQTVKEATTTHEYRQINSKAEESAPHNNKHKSMSQVSSLTEIKDDSNINKHGHSFRHSEDHDKTKKEKQIEDQIHSRIEAFKDAVRRKTDMEAIITNEYREINSKAEESAPHYDYETVIKQCLSVTCIVIALSFIYRIRSLYRKHTALRRETDIEGADFLFPYRHGKNYETNQYAYRKYLFTHFYCFRSNFKM
jgi:hypothetical protein